MSEPKPVSSWKTGLKEANVIGWLVLGVVIFVILAGALTFGRGPPKDAQNAANESTSQRSTQ